MESAQFAADLQNTRHDSSDNAASSSKDLHVEHTIVAVATAREREAQTFLDTYNLKNGTAEAFGTSTQIYAHPSIDAVFVAGPQTERYQEALSALRGGKCVLLHKPLALSSTEVKTLCDTADKEQKRWLGLLLKSKTQDSLLWAADECAVGMTRKMTQSEKMPWSDALSVIEALEDIRDSGISFDKFNSDRADAFNSVNSPDNSFATLEGNYRPGSRASMMSDATFHSVSAVNGEVRPANPANSASASTLRAQIHELKHVLRQKTAIIASLEQKAGLSSGPNERLRNAVRSRNSLPASTPNRIASPGLSPRLRTSSMDSDAKASASPRISNAQEAVLPFSDVANTADTSLGSRSASANRRRRVSAGTNTTSITLNDSPLLGSSSNQLGLETVPEGSGQLNAMAVATEGFLSPTIASESRRMANSAAQTGLGSPITTSPGAFSILQNGTPSPTATGRGSSKVIEQLTTELHAVRMSLEDMRSQLRTSQRTIGSLQRSMDEKREALGRSRAENEASVQMLARKDRQNQEALERARKAETQAKELGKSSREWGTRVRKVEAELGEERILKQRAEMQYEAIAASWKQTREAWEKEMKELRMTHGERTKRDNDRLAEIRQQFQKRDEHGNFISAAVAELQEERRKASIAVAGPVRELVEQLERFEQHTKSQDASVKEVQDELNRILRLMRNGA
jgi:hypothetical protein